MALDAIVHRKDASSWRTFVESPWPTLAKLLYSQRTIMNKTPRESASYITVVCISDIHNTQPELPEGDLLLVAGDLTEHGTIEEFSRQLDWLSERPHLYKVVIAGNHDVCLDPHKSAQLSMLYLQRNDWRWDNITYLEDSSTVLQFPRGRSLKIYGSPWTKKYGNWAFQFEKGKGRDYFSGRVEDDTDILVTHSPPRCHLDLGEGDDDLLREIWRVRPKLHCWGHMHAGHGRDVLIYDRFQYLYERVCRGQAGVLSVVLMVVLLAWHKVFPLDNMESATTIVNAAVVGGRSNKKRRDVQVFRL
jgi:predicted phosphohydrolase